MEPQDSSPEFYFPYVGKLSPEAAKKSLMEQEGWVMPHELTEADIDYWHNMEVPPPPDNTAEEAAQMWANWTKEKQREMYLANQIKDKLQRNRKKPGGWGDRKKKYFVDFLVSEMFANPGKYSIKAINEEAVEVLHFLTARERGEICHLLLSGDKRRAVNAIVEFLKRYGG